MKKQRRRFSYSDVTPIQAMVRDLVRKAEEFGVVVEIKLVPLTPLAMGNYRMEFDVRPERVRVK